MKWTLYFMFFALLSCSQMLKREPANLNDRHIVFDLDWTVVSEIKNPSARSLNNKRVIQVQGIHYYINEGVEEFVAEILKHPEIKISFYSGGKTQRNNELLSKINLPSGKSLKDIAYKVLSYEDLVTVEGVAANARFSERFKKDFSKISKNMDQLIMFDDTANFFVESADNQGSSAFFIGTSYEFFEKFEDTKGLDGSYVPRTYNEWLLDRKKMYVLMGAFKEAYINSNKGTMTFSEAMKKEEALLKLDRHEWNEFSSKYYQTFFKDFEVKNTLPSLDCHQMARALMGI